MTTNEMIMTAESGSGIDSDDIAYESDESKFLKKEEILLLFFNFLNQF